MPIEANIDLSGIPDAPDPGIDLSGIPDADFQNTQSEAKKVMGEAWKTAQETGNIYPVAEAAAEASVETFTHLLTSIVGLPIAGFGAALALPTRDYEGMTKIFNTINEWLVYQPKTKVGTSLSRTALYPFEKLQQGAAIVGEKIMKETGNPYLATAISSIIIGAPALIGLRFLPKAVQAKFNAWKKTRPDMSVESRAVVLQKLENAMKARPNLTEGQLVRKFDQFREEALARRAEGEKVVPIRKVEEVKPGVEKPIVVKPAEKPIVARETIEAKFNREVAEIVRKETDLTDAEVELVFLGGEVPVKPTVEIPVEAKPKVSSVDFKDHISSYLEYLSNLVKAGEAGKRIRVTDLDGTEQWIGVATTYPDFMRDQGLTGKEVEVALNKAVEGKTLTDKQAGIVQNALEQAQEMFLQEVGGMPEADLKVAEASIDKAVEAFFKKPELIKATKVHLAKVRKALKPRKVRAPKKAIREITGQIKISKMVEGLTERTALADQIRFEVRAARDAYRAGKLEATIKHRNKAISLYRRRERLRAIRDYLVIPEAIMKKLTKNRDIALMSDWEFKQYKDDLLVKAVELTEQLEAKNRLIKLISDKRLQRVDNYRRALELPPIGKMTIKELEEFEKLLEPFADEDVFLTERELETVDRTDLKGIRTWREARLRLAKEVGATIEQIEAIKVHELDDYRYDTALAEQNPFYRMLVTESARKLLEADARYYEIEAKALVLAKKAEKSRARTLIERAIPQDKKIMEYMEAPQELKPALAEQLTPEQLDFAHYMEEYFGNALDYLIQIQALTKGRENYFVHMRRTFLEEVKESGLKKAFLSLYKNYRQDEAVFNILDEDTGNILPMEKFFQFALHRSGELLPTANITRAFTAYVRMFEKKRSYDELIPKMDIYAQALTPQKFTPRGLEIDRSIKKFVNKYINSKKGRRIRWIGKQYGVIDLSIRAARTFTSVLDLGLNIPVSIASLIGEQATTLQGVGVAKYALGIKRLQTEQGKKIIKENIAFVGKSVFAELAEPGKIVTERFMEGLFSLFRIATVTANKQFLLGSLTKQEFQSGKISSKRLSELKIEMGRWRKVMGAESLVGATGAGGAAVQYKTWAVPIISTTLRDIKIFVKDMKAKGVNEALKSREAAELWRFFLIGSFVAIVGIMIAAEKDDRSFIGQMKAKAYRELNTLMQGIGPGLWLSVPRILVFAKQLGANLQDILTLERYKTKRGLKGVEGLKRQLTPVAVKQFTREKKTGGRERSIPTGRKTKRKP